MANARGVGWAAVCVAAGLLAAGPAESADKPPADAAHKASAESLKELAIAFHNYASAHNEFPPAAVVGPDGKPLYSWRVVILPYLGEKKLYDEFRPGEAWDGPNNKKLLAKMPKV